MNLNNDIDFSILQENSSSFLSYIILNEYRENKREQK